jgi:hypothetical protein
MTEIEELTKAWLEAKERIEENSERARWHLERAKEGRQRMLEVVGIRTVKEPRRQ